MLPVLVSYVSMLWEAARRCCLPYTSIIHEVANDGSHMYGVELELTDQVTHGSSATLFFWANSGVQPPAAYEAAAFQGLVVLQSIYGFIVVDYSLHGLQLYRTLSHRLFPLANRGLQLARLVLAASHQPTPHLQDVIGFAQQLLDEASIV